MNDPLKYNDYERSPKMQELWTIPWNTMIMNDPLKYKNYERSPKIQELWTIPYNKSIPVKDDESRCSSGYSSEGEPEESASVLYYKVYFWEQALRCLSSVLILVLKCPLYFKLDVADLRLFQFMSDRSIDQIYSLNS